MTKQLEEKIDYIVERLSKIETLLTGNGDSAKGIIVRLDRVEIAMKRRDVILGAVLGIVGTALASQLASLVFERLQT